jgi:hypothetical protein
VKQQPRKRAGERPERAVPPALSWGTDNLTGRWFRTGLLTAIAKWLTLPAIPSFSWRTESLTRIEKARRSLATARNLEVGGAVGGNGWRQRRSTGRGTGPSPAVAVVVAVAVAVAVAYILHLSESTPKTTENSRYNVCTGEIV